MSAALGTLFDTYGEALIAFAIAVGVGFAIDTVLFRVLRSRAKARGWKTSEALARGLHGLPTAAAAVIGARWGIARLGLTGTMREGALTSVRVAGIVVVTYFAARIAGRFIRAYTEREDARLPSSSIFVNLARALVWVIGGIMVLAAFGVSIAPLLTALGVGGLAVGLALQSTLENVFSGIQVLLSRQIQPGDFVQLETGQQGWVQDVTWRNTTIRLFSNDLVIVPNATIGKSVITNFTTSDQQHVVTLDLGVGYECDLDTVERVTLDVARQVQQDFPDCDPDFEPVFRFREFGDSSILLSVSVRARSIAAHFPLKHEFIKTLKARYDAEGIAIPFPQRTIHMAPGQSTAEE